MRFGVALIAAATFTLSSSCRPGGLAPHQSDGLTSFPFVDFTRYSTHELLNLIHNSSLEFKEVPLDLPILAVDPSRTPGWLQSASSFELCVSFEHHSERSRWDGHPRLALKHSKLHPHDHLLIGEHLGGHGRWEALSWADESDRELCEDRRPFGP